MIDWTINTLVTREAFFGGIKKWFDTTNFPGSIPPKFEHKLCRHKQRYGKIATNVVSCRGTQGEYSSKPLKHSIVERILVFKR